MKLPSIKIQMIFLLSILAFCLSIIKRDASFLSSVFIAVTAAVFLDSLIIYFKTKHFTVSDSSVISGLIIGYVVSGQELWWKLIFASILAIASKHLIHFRNKHLFNPAAFGIFLSVILFNVAIQWRGADLWYIFVPIGIYFVWKIRKLEILSSYMFIFLILFGIHAFVQKSSLLYVLKYQNYFFIFVMLIEPKTTPVKPLGKWIFGVFVAVLIFVLTQFSVTFDAELAGLLLANMSVPLLNKLR